MATRYLRIAFNVNGGHVQNESSSGAAASNFYHSAGLTSYTSYTASTSYKYFKGTTGAVTGCATSGGTYATHYQRIASTNSYPNLVNVATFNIVRGGYHIVGTSAYRTTATGGTVLNQDYSSSSTTNPATYAKLGGSTSANKTVTIYVNWTPNEYSVAFNANGGTGTMSTETGFKYGTAKALTSNSFTRTGYTFSGWSTTPNGNGTWESLWSSSSADGYTTLETSLRVHYNTLYLYYDSAWHSFNLTAKSVSSTSAPATWINGSASYSSCSPAPTNAPIGAISYISCIGQTYCLTKTNTSSGNATLYLYRWNPGQSFTNGASVTTLESCPYSDETVTLYAQWTRNTYNVLLDDNAADGTGTGLTTLTMTYGLTTNNSVTPPTRFGHTFDGYYDTEEEIIYNSSGNAVAGSYWKGTWTSVFTVRGTGPCRADHIGTDGTYLYLKYNSQYYQVSVDNSNSYTLLSSTPSCNWKVDHEPIAYQGFNYYFNTAYATTTQNYVVYIYRYYVGTSGVTWQGTSNVPLIAKWIPKVKSFKLDPNGGTYNGTTSATTKTVTYGTSENSSVGVPTRAGYRFDGWYYSTGSSQQIFNSAGNAISDALNGPWYNASPTNLASGAKYIHYGDYVWGIYANSSTGLHVCLWEGDEWTEKMTDSAITSFGSNFPKGLGKLIVIVATINQTAFCATCSADADIWSGGISTLLTPLYSYSIFGEVPYSGSSTTLPNKGKIWLYDNSTTPVPTYYAHWTPKIYVKQNGSWVEGSPRVNVNGTWKSPTSAYVKVNGTWKPIY